MKNSMFITIFSTRMNCTCWININSSQSCSSRRSPRPPHGYFDPCSTQLGSSPGLATNLGCCQLLNLWIFQILHCLVNPIQCYHRTNMTPLIILLRTIERNVAYGCHTELANLLIFTRGGDRLTSGQSYKSLMRFIDPNCDTLESDFTQCAPVGSALKAPSVTRVRYTNDRCRRHSCHI